MTSKCDLPEDTSRRVILGLCLLQRTHLIAHSTLILLEKDVPTAVWSLARPLLEGFVRAIWILECAKEQAVDEVYEEERKFPKLSDAIKSISQSGSDHARWLDLANEKLPVLNDFVHGGIQTCIRQFDGTNIRPDYPVCHQLDFLDSFVKPILLNSGLELLDRLGFGESKNMLMSFVAVLDQDVDFPR
ncbi:MAG: hypothetical protein F4039_10775 [Gammaproteobacteria bacterium]|nr:hypothetical protein [Gammaproteobacteria bacterium]MYF52757.1 hypothetical protein [Gammaproteobacteria bacterium]MYK44549.1 hypothetical protein [Gammaproteobacteria bacterium]